MSQRITPSPIVLWLALVLSCQTLFGFQENIEDYVEKHSAAFVVMEDPATTLQLAVDYYMGNKKIQRVQELLVDERFSLATEAQLAEVGKGISRIYDGLSQMSEVSIIVHSCDDAEIEAPRFSLVFAGTHEAKDLLAGGFESLTSHPRNDVEDNDKHESNFFSEFAERFFSQLSVTRTDDLLLISNAPDEVKSLLERIVASPDKKFPSLSKQRSWLQVQRQLDEKSESPQIRGYVSPERFPTLVSWLLRSRSWQLPIFSLNSLSSVGFQIQLQDTKEPIPTPQGKFRPIISWHSVVNRRLPSEELAKLIESYKPLPDIPNFPFELTFVEASGFDFGLKQAANCELHHKLFGQPDSQPFDPKNPTENEIKTFWSEFDVGAGEMPAKFDLEPVLRGYDGRIHLYHTGLEAFVGSEVRIDMHSDQAAMRKILDLQVKEEDLIWTKKIEPYVPVDYGHGIHLARKQNSEKTLQKIDGLQPTTEEEAQDPNAQNQPDSVRKKRFAEYIANSVEFYINDEMMIVADNSSMYQMLVAFEKPVKPQAFNLLYDRARKKLGSEECCKVAFRSHRLLLNSLEEQHIWDSVASKHERLGNANNIKKVAESGLKILNSTPDEFGLRIELKTQKDARVAVQQLLLNALTDTFGTSMTLYSVEGQQFNAFGHIYSFEGE